MPLQGRKKGTRDRRQDKDWKLNSLKILSVLGSSFPHPLRMVDLQSLTSLDPKTLRKHLQERSDLEKCKNNGWRIKPDYWSSMMTPIALIEIPKDKREREKALDHIMDVALFGAHNSQNLMLKPSEKFSNSSES